jgi:acyl-CoA synthetase (NDP forming)
MQREFLFDPNSVAIIGASDNKNKIGGRPIHYMVKFGFKGAIYPINPVREEVQGLHCYATLVDLPEVPEVVIIAVSGSKVIDAVETSAKLGVKAVIIISSGFGETGAEGKVQERLMLDLAHKAGMRIVGPNSQGLANFATGAILSFSTMFIEAEPKDGPIACISQSGAMSVVPYGLFREQGLGVRYVHASGNDSDVTASELVVKAVNDPSIRLVSVYMENISDPENLAAAASIARKRGVPIIVLKSGRSERGRQAAASHTGALATSDRVLDAFFRKHGIWRANSTNDLVHAAQIYLNCKPSRGRNLAIISNSGATCVIGADAAEQYNLQLPNLEDATEVRLKAVLPAFATTQNPIDITAALLTNSGLFSDILPILADDPNVDAFLIGIPVSGEGYDVNRFANDTHAFMRQTGKPVVVSAPQRKIRQAFSQYDIPVYATEHDAISALSQFLSHHELMALVPAFAPLRKCVQAEVVSETLSEHDSLTLLESVGVGVVNRRLCETLDDALAFLAEVDGPIVLKACSGTIPHKSDKGLVVLGLDSRDDVEKAYNRMVDRLQAEGLSYDGILAAPMVKAEVEMIIGGHYDPTFGPVVVIGEGGIFVEQGSETRILIPPFTQDDISESLSELRIGRYFRHLRGQTPFDVEPIYRTANALVSLMMSDKHRVRSIDINPVFVSSYGATAVDALIEVAARSGGEANHE